MKPSFRNLFRAALPAVIVVPMLSQPLRAGSSNIINPDAAGDVNVAGNYDELNGSDWTVRATGGSSSPFLVTIGQGASLTGESSLMNAVEVASGYYTIDNSGSLNASRYGILSMAGDTVIKNHQGALIQGGWDGISLQGQETISLIDTVEVVESGASITNEGEILGSGNGI